VEETQVSRTLVLKIQRNLAGKEFPFDRVYLFQQADEALIPRILPYSMVLSLTAALRTMLTKVTKDYKKGLVASAMTRSGTEELQRTLESSSLGDEMQIPLKHPGKWLVVVPMLWRMRSAKTVWPQYLAAKARYRKGKHSLVKNRTPLLAKVVSSKSYLLVDGQAYRPICLACARALESMQGTCQPGSETCYVGLEQVGVARFARSLRNFISASGGQDAGE